MRAASWCARKDYVVLVAGGAVDVLHSAAKETSADVIIRVVAEVLYAIRKNMDMVVASKFKERTKSVDRPTHCAGLD